MSPRAACRLEAIGFTQVYDYVLGKADWKAGGLELEGTNTEFQTIADAMRADLPTCEPTETVGEVRTRVTEAGWSDCIVSTVTG